MTVVRFITQCVQYRPETSTIHCTAGIVVAGFEQNQYDVDETDLSLSVCAIQMANIERDVDVVFSAESQSAISKLYR